MNYLQKQQIYEEKFNLEIVHKQKTILSKCRLDEYYNNLIEINPHTSDELQRAKLWILNIVSKEIKKDSLILDAGCGVGEDTFRFENQGYIVTGIDKSKIKLDFCSLLGAVFNDKRIEFIQSDILGNPFCDKWFDLSYSSMVVEHMISPINGLRAMAKTSRYVCGIIHMGEKAEDNPYHTHFLTIDDVKYYLDNILESGYTLEVLDKYVFAMFFGKSRVKSDYNNCYSPTFGFQLSEDLGVDSSLWKVKNIYCADVSIDNIESVFEPKHRISYDVIYEYVDCLDIFGKKVVETFTFPIRLIKFSDTHYRVWGDGAHRVYALKKYNKIKTFRAYIIEVEKRV